MIDNPQEHDFAATTAAPAFPGLPQEFSVYSAAETRRQWLAWWEAGGRNAIGAVVVDGAAVDAVDGAGIQLLVALNHLLGGHDRALRLARPSEPLRTACTATGLSLLLFESVAA